MQSLFAFTILALSMSSFAGNGTCSAGSKRVYVCETRDGAEYDFCQTKKSYGIKVMGEEYAYRAKRTDKLDTSLFTGTNTDGVEFRFQIENSKHTSLLAYLTLNPDQINKETVTLLCKKT